MSDETRVLRHLLRQLRRDFPVRGKLRVLRRRVSQPRDGIEYGYALRGKRGRYTIVMHNTLSVALMVELLLHEYAHVLCWDVKPDHSRQWAATYARLRRWFQEEHEYAPRAA